MGGTNPECFRLRQQRTIRSTQRVLGLPPSLIWSCPGIDSPVADYARLYSTLDRRPLEDLGIVKPGCHACKSDNLTGLSPTPLSCIPRATGLAESHLPDPAILGTSVIRATVSRRHMSLTPTGDAFSLGGFG